MTYELFIGNYAYSSWSLRAWLLFDRFDIPHSTTLVDFDLPASVAEQMPSMAPAKTVPALRMPDGTILGDSFAIAEELASLHPDLGLWPGTPQARATARNLVAEMHAGFTALRSACPMNLRLAYGNFTPDSAVLLDLARFETLRTHARKVCAPQGPWLCGDYSIVDAFYAPVAARIAGYGLPVSPETRTYVDAHLADLAFRRWRAMALVSGPTLARYAMAHSATPWPGPAPLTAKAVDTGTPENTKCPYSGKPVTHLLEIEGRIFGFCSAFCRDKTLADPAAWPAFTALL